MNESEQTAGVFGVSQLEVTPDTVRRHLLRILSSEAFQGSRRSGTLLEALIEARLENRMDDLKEHKLAQRFFPDLSGFKSSSIYKMRGVFKRMRVRLQAYYRTEGKFDDIIISFPNSLYVPDFSLRSGKTVLPPPPAPVAAKPAQREVRIAPRPETDEGEDESPAALPLAEPPAPLMRTSELAEAPATQRSMPPAPVRTRRHRAKRKPKPQTPSGYRWAVATAIAAIPVLAGVGLFLSSRTEVLAPLPEFTQASRLTADSELALDPSLSSNGKYIVYASDKETSGNLNIWMIALDEKGRVAKRVTRSEFEESQPTISPDGNTAAFFSMRDGGGVWTVSTKGGEPKLLAAGGRRPRFSPDGRNIAFWAPSTDGGRADSRLFVVASAGGTPRQLVRDFLNAEHPAWSPDGHNILFVGRPIPPAPKHAEDEPVPEAMDWWVTSPEDRTPVRTGALPTGISDILFGPPGSWTPYANRIVADSMQSGERRPVAVAMDPTFKRMGGTESVTSPGIANGQPFLANGRLASSRIEIISQITSVPVDPEEGRATGAAQVLSPDSGGNEFLATLNAAGTQIAFVAERKGSFNTYVRELASGKERRVSNIPQGWSPVYSRDGRTLAILYPAMGQAGSSGGSGAIEIHGPGGASKPIPCDRCEKLIAVTNDGQKVLYTARNPRNPAWIGMLDVANNRHTTILGHPSIITSADWSPNQKFIAYGNRAATKGNQIMMAAFSGSGDASKPFEIVGADFNNDRPHFSPDGKVLYFLSDRDRFTCLYGLRIDTAKGQPIGEPYAVHHFHKRRLAIDAVPAPVQVLSVSANRVALTAQRVMSGVFFSEAR